MITTSRPTYVATGKVSTLKHEIRNDAVKRRALITKAFLAGAKRTEVLGGLGNDIVVKIEVDAASLLYS